MAMSHKVVGMKTFSFQFIPCTLVQWEREWEINKILGILENGRKATLRRSRSYEEKLLVQEAVNLGHSVRMCLIFSRE